MEIDGGRSMAYVDVDGWIEIRNGQGRLLCRINPRRALLEIKPKGATPELIDLERYFSPPLIVAMKAITTQN